MRKKILSKIIYAICILITCASISFGCITLHQNCEYKNEIDKTKEQVSLLEDKVKELEKQAEDYILTNANLENDLIDKNNTIAGLQEEVKELKKNLQ